VLGVQASVHHFGPPELQSAGLEQTGKLGHDRQPDSQVDAPTQEYGLLEKGLPSGDDES